MSNHQPLPPPPLPQPPLPTSRPSESSASPSDFSPAVLAGDAADARATLGPPTLPGDRLTDERPVSQALPKPARWGPAAALGAIAVLIVVGSLAWLLFRPGGPYGTPTSGWSSGPQLQGTYRGVGLKSGGEWTVPYVLGEPDDLFVIGAGTPASTVSHHVEGKLDWSVDVDGGVPVWRKLPIPDGVLIVTKDELEADTYVLTRLDTSTGETVWTLSTENYALPTMFDGRLYAVGVSSVVEYDIGTGDPLQRLDVDQLLIDLNVDFDPEFMAVDTADGTVQRYNLDFEPVGSAVTIEPSGNDDIAWMATRFEDQWVYLSRGRIVGLSDDGDITFECATTIDSPTGFLRSDDVLVVASSTDAERIAIDGSTCSSAWSYSGDNLFTVGESLVVQQFADDRNETANKVFDIVTGEQRATPTGQVILGGQGQMLVSRNGRTSLIEIATGTTLWSVDYPPLGVVRAVSSMMFIVVPTGDEGNVLVYADN